MAAMAPGTVQLNNFAWNQKLTKYVKNGQSEKAMQLFQQMPQEGMSPNKFTSVQVIKACAVLGALEEGRLVHEQLIQSGCVQPNSVTFVGVLNACASVLALEEGRSVHEQISRSGCECDVFVGNGLVDMYAKCVEPDDITFVCLLSVCGHAGLVDEGMCCYASMITDYMISAKYKHDTCMEAENMVMAVPWKPNVAAWMALLSTCRIHGNLKPENSAGYVLLTNIYSSAGNRHLYENLGHTWIEVNNEVHMFVVEDQDHPQMIEIHAELERLSGIMHDAGYLPYSKLVLHDVEEEEKEKICWFVKIATEFISKIVGRAIMPTSTFSGTTCTSSEAW
ncbi:hypothetical protein CY35_12G001600 [Sphagnum magellanicum]|nr:hypothetical protein CY35_12G001600 [Sphagnum magellanicum]